MDLATTQGPLADEIQFNNVMKFIEIGKTEGKLAFGGKRSGTKGYFVEPTRASLPSCSAVDSY